MCVTRLLGGGFNPFEKYETNWTISPSRREHGKCLKPPPKLGIWQCFNICQHLVYNSCRNFMVSHPHFAKQPPLPTSYLEILPTAEGQMHMQRQQQGFIQGKGNFPCHQLVTWWIHHQVGMFPPPKKKTTITLLRVIPTMTCWVEVVRWGLSLRIWWEEWRIWEHWFQVSLA